MTIRTLKNAHLRLKRQNGHFQNGDEGSRTLVQKCFKKSFYGRSLSKFIPETASR